VDGRAGGTCRCGSIDSFFGVRSAKTESGTAAAAVVLVLAFEEEEEAGACR